MTSSARLLIVGNPAEFHVGGHFLRAAQTLNVPVEVCDVSRAFVAPWPILQFNWRLRGHRPPMLNEFSQWVLAKCRQFRPTILLATGLAPLNATVLQQIQALGISSVLYLTDDPWNPTHRAPWFMKALPYYKTVFSPRRANLDDIRHVGCQAVYYLPFAYAPDVHFIEPPTKEELIIYKSDVLFFGGADSDRLPVINSLLKSGFNVALYGGYWERYRVTKPLARGHATLPMLRKAVGGTAVTLCLVRRSNRDGHVMRTYEAPAMGACLLMEDTNEHREIFGYEGGAVVYFNSSAEMIEKARWLLAHPQERQKLAEVAHALITTGKHTYADRLEFILDTNSNDTLRTHFPPTSDRRPGS